MNKNQVKGRMKQVKGQGTSGQPCAERVSAGKAAGKAQVRVGSLQKK